MKAQLEKRPTREELLDRCLEVFVEAGTLDVSLDRLAARVGMSKRMLIHYFGGRENIEDGAMAHLEDRLRAQFSPVTFPARVSPKTVVMTLWERATAPSSRGVLLLVMDVSRRAWSGSKRARDFYNQQQRLWVRLLQNFIPDGATVEQVLQLFQGSAFAYLITGNADSGRRALLRLLSRPTGNQKRRR